MDFAFGKPKGETNYLDPGSGLEKLGTALSEAQTVNGLQVGPQIIEIINTLRDSQANKFDLEKVIHKLAGPNGGRFFSNTNRAKAKAGRKARLKMLRNR